MSASKIKLTEKEEEIMLRIWEHGPCSVKTIIDHLPDPKPHFNTVSTFVRILEQKGYVERTESNSRGFLYFAKLPKNSYRKNAVRKLVSDYFGSNFSMVSALVSENEITPEQLRELLDMVNKK